MSQRAARKVTVEECIALSLSSLARVGVFRAPPGTLCNSKWTDSNQMEILRIYFWWDLTSTGQSFLRINERRSSASRPSPSVDAQSVEIVQNKPAFRSAALVSVPWISRQRSLQPARREPLLLATEREPLRLPKMS